MNETLREGGHPSPFYALVEGSSEFTLVFEVDAAGSGPVFTEDGALIPQQGGKTVEATIQARCVGEARYRLCMNAPFDIETLSWGDEFLAETQADGRLRLTGVVAPFRFVHDTSSVSGPLDPDGSMAGLIHRLGGGWETVFGGLLTVSVPVERWAEYEAGMRAL